MAGDEDDVTPHVPSSPAETAVGKSETQETAENSMDHNNVKTAPFKQKWAFLREKGLSEAEIEQLFSESNETSSATADRNEKVDSDSGTSTTARETPPIITYPEFLLHSQRPRPLVTIQGLLTTAYLVCGAAAITYSASKYLVEPMLGSLTAARHSLHETASANVKTLNTKLEGLASKTPGGIKEPPAGDSAHDAETQDGEAYFSRTVATQTSPPASRATSLASAGEEPGKSVIESQAETMEHLKTSLQQIQAIKEEDALQEGVDDLQGFLTTLPYMTESALFGRGASASKDRARQTEGLAKMKAEIKAMKGTLLSARNFPTTTLR